MMNYFPEEVLEQIFDFVTRNQDRNSISLVCKTWLKVERESRSHVFVGNCYAVSPERVIRRFPKLRALALKGKPHFADINLVPHDWGGFVYPWIDALAKGCPALEELRLKRMVVSDDCLRLMSKSFPGFKSLVLDRCQGFTTDGLATIAANCRYLQELDLQDNVVHDGRGHWLSCFPETCTSLVSLNFACLKGQVNLVSLKRLVARSPNLRSLRLNHAVPFEMLHKILTKAPQLVELGTGSFVHDPNSKAYNKLKNAISKCESIRSLSGFLGVASRCLPVIYRLCSNLTSLNLSYASGINGFELTKLIQHCRKLQRLWILDCIGDKGLAIVASTCKDLEELRVFLSDPYGSANATITEEGLVAISTGCPQLRSVLYICHQMTNAGLISVAKNCPNLTCFRLYILDPVKADPVTGQPLDEGFGAIVQSCKSLRRLSLSGLLTEKVFLYIGMYAEQLEMLYIAFTRDSDKAMIYVLNGCKKLRKLELRACPFGDTAVLMDVGNYETVRSLQMSSCEVTLGACKLLAKKMVQSNVEIINGSEHGEVKPDDDEQRVEKMYLYRTLVGPRQDGPDFVWTL